LQLAQLKGIHTTPAVHEAMNSLVDSITAKQQSQMRRHFLHSRSTSHRKRIELSAKTARAEILWRAMEAVLDAEVIIELHKQLQQRWGEAFCMHKGALWCMSQLDERKRVEVQHFAFRQLLNVEKQREVQIVKEQVHEQRVKMMAAILSESQRKKAMVILGENACLGKNALEERLSIWLHDVLDEHQKAKVFDTLKAKYESLLNNRLKYMGMRMLDQFQQESVSLLLRPELLPKWEALQKAASSALSEDERKVITAAIRAFLGKCLSFQEKKQHQQALEIRVEMVEASLNIQISAAPMWLGQ